MLEFAIMNRRLFFLNCAVCLLAFQRASAIVAQTPAKQPDELLGMGNGNAYLARSVNGLPNFKLVYKKNATTSAETPIGTQQNGHWVISDPAEIPAFEAATHLHVV